MRLYEWSKEKEGKCSSRHELPARCRARSRSPSVRCSARSRSPLVRSLVRHLLHEERRSKTQGGESGNLRARPGGHLAGTRKGRNKCERARPDHLARPPPNNNAHTLTAHADEAFAQHPIIMMGHSLARQPRPNPPENRAAHAPERGTPSVAGGHRTGCIAHSGSLDKVPFLLAPGVSLIKFLRNFPAVFPLRAVQRGTGRAGLGGGRREGRRRRWQEFNGTPGHALRQLACGACGWHGGGPGARVERGGRGRERGGGRAKRASLAPVLCCLLARLLTACVNFPRPAWSEPIHVARCTCCVQRGRCVCARALHIVHALRGLPALFTS